MKSLGISAFIFLTNVVSCWSKNYFLYGGLFLILVITSFIVHNHNTIYTNLLDKIPIVCIVWYGFFLLFFRSYNAWLAFIIFGSFLAVLALYCYGCICKCFIFDSNTNTSEDYHSLMHFISSIGHHFICLL